MTTWTLRQIAQARGLRGTLYVDEALIHRAEAEVTTAARHKLADAIRQMGHSFAIEIHEGDLEFHAWRDNLNPNPFTIRVDCRWSPTTNACEMRGGPQDGEVWANRRPGGPMRFPVLDSTPWLDDSDSTHAEAALTDHVVTYVLTGWSETHRRWVYEVAG